MASIQKTASGLYRAQVYIGGVRDSATFRTKREADAWASARAVELRKAKTTPPGELHTLAEALTRYVAEVSPLKRGRRWEEIRAEAMLRSPALPIGEKLGRVTPEQMAAWRDARLKVVSSGAVLREIGFLSAVFETARREWRWIESNPLRDIRKPRAPDHREVVISRQQIRRLLAAMGYQPRGPVRSVAQSVAVCFLVALRTGMRAGELCGLTWDRVAVDHCALPVTKSFPRKVPFSAKTRRLIERMRGYDPLLVFGLKSASLDANFRKYRDRAGIEGITFHDARHTAATWLARRLDVLDLCRVFGWSNPKQAMIYFNPSASSIAALLDGRK